MQKLLVKDEPDVIFQLCEEVTNLFGKLRWPSDERLLVYHTSFFVSIWNKLHVSVALPSFLQGYPAFSNVQS